MVEQYLSEINTKSRIDVEHYKAVWRLAMKDTNSENLKFRLSQGGIICSPRWFSLEQLTYSDRCLYIEGADKNSVCFINDYNTFYADSFMTFLKMTTFSRWMHSINNLVNTPLHSVKHEEWKIEEFLMVWMFKHNINHTLIKV